ncbi:MAG TPA: SIR2 family protein, partial [Segetibacter sp.]
MEIKGENLLFLLGAGASADAGIPISSKMVEKIETLLREHDDWIPYQNLYFYLKSSINYSDGIFGQFSEAFNVERLLIVIAEIEKRDKNIMYPFIGTWNIRLLDLAGNNFENVSNFKKLIRKQLIEWVGLRNYESAGYYQAFSSLASEIGSLMKVFSLNYDLCFETIVGKEKDIELGFTKATSEWHYSNFDDEQGKSYNLYKLHGSIDWYIEKNKLYKSERPEVNPELIFGIQHKMTSVDPYFYYSAKFREACLNDTKLIISIGYSFADDYINAILSQAINARSELRLLNVSPLFCDEKDKEARKAFEAQTIIGRLNLQNPDQLIFEDFFAKRFMTEKMNKNDLSSYIGEPDDV